MISAALGLMGVCGLLAWCLMRLGHIDALTAYLATSPGGLDSVAIIAASTPRVDLPWPCNPCGWCSLSALRR